MHYVIVGNGVAGIQAAFQIRRRYQPSQARITVISDETDYFFSRTALMYAYMNKMQWRDLEPYEREVYDRQKIERVNGRVVDLDADRGQVTLADGTPIDYDKLLLAVGAKPRMVPWKGLEETDEGVVNFVSRQDREACEELTWSTDRAVVVGGGLIGVELVECLEHHGIETTFLVREPFFWPAGLHSEEGQIITDQIRDHGVDLRHEEELAEIVPGRDGRVEAIVTDQDERIDCQMLGIAIGVVPNIDWLDGVTTPPRTNRGILVDRSFETNLPNVWAAGDCIEVEMGHDQEDLVETIWYAAKRHGRLAGQSMLGDEIDYDPPLFFNSAKFMDIEYTTVGEVTTAPSGTDSLFRKMPGEPISQRIVFDDQERVIGFNMLGSRWEHTILGDWIRERRRLDWVVDHLEEAQFDVEFGRVPLERMEEKEVEL